MQGFTQHKSWMRLTRPNIVNEFRNPSIKMSILILILVSDQSWRMIDITYVDSSKRKSFLYELRQVTSKKFLLVIIFLYLEFEGIKLSIV